MSFASLVSQLLLEVRADTSQARRELQLLQQQEKQNATATKKHQTAMEQQTIAMRRQVDAVDAGNKKLAGYAKGVGMVGLALQGLQSAFQIANAGWQAFAAHADKAGGSAKATADKYREASKEWDAALNRILVFIGEFVAENHGLVRSLAATADAIADIAEAAKDIPGIGGLLGSDTGRKLLTANPFSAYNDLSGKNAPKALDAVDRARDTLAAYATARAQNIIDAMAAQAQGEAAADEVTRAAGKRRRRGGAPDSPYEGHALTDRSGPATDIYGWGWDQGTQSTWTRPRDIHDERAWLQTTFSGVDDLRAKAAALPGQVRDQQKASILEDIFGPPDQFDLYREKFEALNATIDLFAAAAAEGFNAWIDGSKTGVEAFAGIAQSFMKNLAKMAFGEAMMQGAHAIKETALFWATGKPNHLAAAKKHGLAALAYGAVGAAVGYAARGSSGSSGGGGAGAGTDGGAPTVTGPFQGGSGGHRSITIINGDPFGDDSPIMTARKTARSIQRAKRYLDDDRYVVHG